MRLTQGQLRRMIVREAKRVLQEVDSDVATPQVGTGVNTGDVSAEKIVHDFFKTLHDGGKVGLKFEDVIKAAQDAYEDWGMRQEESAPQTQRSPVKSERLLRNYLRTLLEALGDENDFRAKFPNLSSLVKFYMDNGNLWMLPYDKDEMQKSIFDGISNVYKGYAGFMKAMTRVGGDLMKIRIKVRGTAGETISKFLEGVFVPALSKMKDDMPSGEGMGWLEQPEVRGRLGKAPPPLTDPAQPVSANYPTQRPPKSSLSGLPLTYPPTKKS